jgi:hypothetical protein
MVPRPVRDPLGQTACPRCAAARATAPAPAPTEAKFAGLGLRPCISIRTRLPIELQRHQQRHQSAARGPDPRRLVEHRRPAAQHAAARVLHAGGRCAEAQLHHRTRYRAGHEAGGAGSVHRVKTIQFRYLDSQSGVAEPVAAGHLVPAREPLDAAGRRGSDHRVQGLGQVRRLIEVAG